MWSTYPSSTYTGSNRSIKLNGSNFIPTSVVLVNGAAWTTTYTNSTTLTAVGNLPVAGTFNVAVRQPDPAV